LLPTLLDRLVDNAPTTGIEVPEHYAMSASQMREVVQRDLSWLLNTTSLEDEINRALYPEAAASVINYGVPPFAGTFMGTRRWEEVDRIIRRAILDFEPRLLPESLQIVPLTPPGGEHQYNVLLFEIRGLVYMRPYPAEFMVQSSLDLETSRLQFKLRG
jgi:type VI secretion system protein ImpF